MEIIELYQAPSEQINSNISIAPLLHFLQIATSARVVPIPTKSIIQWDFLNRVLSKCNDRNKTPKGLSQPSNNYHFHSQAPSFESLLR